MAARSDLSILPGGTGAALRFRALGRVEDLDIDFAAPDRPRLVTTVLACCAEPPQEAGTVIALTLAARIGGLLAVWTAGNCIDTLEFRLRCPVGTCGADLEAAVPVDALMELARTAETTRGLSRADLTLRRPTGADQRRWRAAMPCDDPEAAILASLLESGTLPTTQEARDDLAEALAEFDPLPAFSVAARCPDCGAEATHPIDLEGALLDRLAADQSRLFTEIDTLARRYGWRDIDILAMPARRRARYLRIAETAEGWM
ncbi:hypothetical protein [Pararhodobacter sp. SW119]|uniref:hypothetical protein n=1 Tax=Pararhodobacter sp. SW119 TaxID=2780075 RepID=UPI001ADECED5|nr:hypothetical protein [Pararhodobacter sp. SW119]